MRSNLSSSISDTVSCKDLIALRLSSSTRSAINLSLLPDLELLYEFESGLSLGGPLAKPNELARSGPILKEPALLLGLRPNSNLVASLSSPSSA